MYAGGPLKRYYEPCLPFWLVANITWHLTILLREPPCWTNQRQRVQTHSRGYLEATFKGIAFASLWVWCYSYRMVTGVRVLS